MEAATGKERAEKEVELGKLKMKHIRENMISKKVRLQKLSELEQKTKEARAAAESAGVSADAEEEKQAL